MSTGPGPLRRGGAADAPDATGPLRRLSLPGGDAGHPHRGVGKLELDLALRWTALWRGRRSGVSFGGALGRPLLRDVLGPRLLGLRLGGELLVRVADVVALLVVGVLPERLAVLGCDLAALGGLLDRQADPAPLQVDVDDL